MLIAEHGAIGKGWLMQGDAAEHYGAELALGRLRFAFHSDSSHRHTISSFSTQFLQGLT